MPDIISRLTDWEKLFHVNVVVRDEWLNGETAKCLHVESCNLVHRGAKTLKETGACVLGASPKASFSYSRSSGSNYCPSRIFKN